MALNIPPLFATLEPQITAHGTETVISPTILVQVTAPSLLGHAFCLLLNSLPGVGASLVRAEKERNENDAATIIWLHVASRGTPERICWVGAGSAADVATAISQGADILFSLQDHPAELYQGLIAATEGRTHCSSYLLPVMVEAIRLQLQTTADGLTPPRMPESSCNNLSASRGTEDVTTAEFLTWREAEVAELAATGLSNQEIADHLFIGLTTVKGHMSEVFAKLGIRRRSQIAAVLQTRRGGFSIK